LPLEKSPTRQEVSMPTAHPLLPLPTAAQRRWLDHELGAIIHFDMQVYDPTYNYGDAGRTLRRPPDVKLFNPRQLDTDQWLEAAVFFPRYEEYWSILKASGKDVIFMVDGCIDAFVDDVMACGACGIISEPFTDFRRIARGYQDAFIAGEGDCRVLMRQDKKEIRAMVERMVETSRMSGGYMMCVGNHIPFNVPPAAVKYYFDVSAEIGFR